MQMLWLSMQLEYVVEQLVRTFNRFDAVKSTAGFLFELETVSAGRIGSELTENFS